MAESYRRGKSDTAASGHKWALSLAYKSAMNAPVLVFVHAQR
jgi:hypothetical protein